MRSVQCSVYSVQIGKLRGYMVISRSGLPFVYRVYRFFDGLNIFLGFGLVRIGSVRAF